MVQFTVGRRPLALDLFAEGRDALGVGAVGLTLRQSAGSTERRGVRLSATAPAHDSTVFVGSPILGAPFCLWFHHWPPVRL